MEEVFFMVGEDGGGHFRTIRNLEETLEGFFEEDIARDDAYWGVGCVAFERDPEALKFLNGKAGWPGVQVLEAGTGVFMDGNPENATWGRALVPNGVHDFPGDRTQAKVERM